ncbi:MAG: ATP-binding protein [Myxococcaceae bacterium]
MTSNAPDLQLQWLIRLRWGAAVAQLILCGAVAVFFSIDVPWLPVSALVAVELLSNAIVAFTAKRRQTIANPALPVLLTLDVVLFTALLFLTGGVNNPFSFLYLVYIALGAVVLRPALSWALAVLALLLFGSLFFTGDPESEHMQHMGMHLRGMWVAFGVASGFIVYFVQRVTRSLAEREAELNEARLRAVRQERLTSLATLAAGAAHELSTPLSAIAVASKELQLALGSGTGADDVKLIREQLDRCRSILSQMAADSGATEGEAATPLKLADWVAKAADGLAGRDRVDASMPDEEVVGPPRALVHALRGVLKNALQASSQPVEVRFERTGQQARLVVKDRGAGMSDQVLARASEPFFTTKAPGEGMGLGLFLTRSVIEQLGGKLELSSVAGSGTTAVLALPAGTVRPHV